MTNGRQCKSPAMHEAVFCYFHSHLNKRHQPFRYNDATRGYLIPGQHIELSAIEDRESLQVAISVVVNALATGQLDTHRAHTLFYGLQLAGNHVGRLDTQPYAPTVVLSYESSPEGLPLAEAGNTIEVLDDEQLRAEEKENEDDDDDLDEDEGSEADDRKAYQLWRSTSCN
jgi:hypothetical protein